MSESKTVSRGGSGDCYTPSPRPYRGLGDLDYPLHDWAATVTNCGRICFKNRKVNLSQVFAGQQVGVRQVSERVWLVTFMHYDVGYFDARRAVSSRSKTRLVQPCYPCLRNNPLPM